MCRSSRSNILGKHHLFQEHFFIFFPELCFMQNSCQTIHRPLQGSQTLKSSSGFASFVFLLFQSVVSRIWAQLVCLHPLIVSCVPIDRPRQEPEAQLVPELPGRKPATGRCTKRSHRYEQAAALFRRMRSGEGLPGLAAAGTVCPCGWQAELSGCRRPSISLLGASPLWH